MLEFVDSDLYFVQDKNNFINPLIQEGSGSVKKSTGSGGPKIIGSERSRILNKRENIKQTQILYTKNKDE